MQTDDPDRIIACIVVTSSRPQSSVPLSKNAEPPSYVLRYDPPGSGARANPHSIEFLLNTYTGVTCIPLRNRDRKETTTYSPRSQQPRNHGVNLTILSMATNRVKVVTLTWGVDDVIEVDPDEDKENTPSSSSPVLSIKLVGSQPSTTDGNPLAYFLHMCVQFQIKSPNTKCIEFFQSSKDVMSAVEEIRMQHNYLGARGTNAFLSSLWQYKSLRVLDLDCVGMDATALSSLYYLASVTPSLFHIIVTNNRLTEFGGDILLRIARSCKHVQRMQYQEGNIFSDYLVKRIENYLNQNRELASQDLYNVFSSTYAALETTTAIEVDDWQLLYTARASMTSLASFDAPFPQALLSLVVLTINAAENNTWDDVVRKGIVLAGSQWSNERGVRRQGVLDAVKMVGSAQLVMTKEGPHSAAVVRQYEVAFLKVMALVVRTMYPQYVE